MMLSNAVKKEDGTEVARTCNYQRFVGVMSHANVEWKELYGEFGKDIKAKIINQTITKGELYDVCSYLGVDYRYITMERDDYEYDIHNFVTDPRIKEGNVPFLEEEHASDAKRPVKTSAGKCRKMVHGTAAQREPNNIDANRLKNLLDAEGIGYNLLREFLGSTAPNITQLMKAKTLPLYTTENIAWFLETTPEYLTGLSDISWLGAENVKRHVMRTQTVLLNSEVLTKYRDKLHGNKFLSQEMILWMTVQDSMVSPEFAERIARMVGLKGKASAVTTKRCNKYDSEPSMVSTFITTVKFQEKCEARETALESVSSEPVPSNPVSAEPVPADTESVQDTELTEASIQNVSLFISEPISAEQVQKTAEPITGETDTESVSDKPVSKNTESHSESIPRDVLEYIDGMTDEGLELLNGYIESLKTTRSFRSRLKTMNGNEECN